MQVVGDFNKLSEQLQKLVKPLKPGEVAQWQRIFSSELHQINRDMSKTTGRVYPHMEFYAKDTIYDPWGGPTGDGAPVDIGVVARGGIDFTKKEIKAFQLFAFERSIHGGIVVLDGKNPIHREMHEFFQLSNLNGLPVQGKEHRSSEVDAIIFPVDPKSESSRKSKRFSTKVSVMQHVELMTVEQMREFAAGKNWDYQADPDELAPMLMEYADKDPEGFNRDLSDPDMRKKATVKYALMESRIKFDSVQYRMLWPNDTVIVNMERVKGEDEVMAFVRWLSTAPNADKVLQQLAKRAKAVPA